MMQRMLAIAVGLAALLCSAASSAAQPATRVVRIGYLSPSSQAAAGALAQHFSQGMREHGYVEGENLFIDYRWADGRYERLSGLAAELIALNPDVLVTATSFAARAAKHATTNVPIVMVAVADPIGQGLIASFAQPGGNVTGLSGQYEDLIEKEIEFLNTPEPKISRVAVLLDPSSPSGRAWLGHLQLSAQRLGVKLLPVQVSGPGQLQTALANSTKEPPDALLLLPHSILFTIRREIAELALARRLRTISTWREFAEAGGLMSYGQHLGENYKRAATYVDKILKGANPADLPVEQPTTFELVINLRTARSLGVTIPQSMLMRADEVIE